MAKRFTDTDKWKRKWFCELDPKAKLVWFYVLDQCDHRGVWFENFDLLSKQVGFRVTPNDFSRWFGEKIVFFDEDKYFIPTFVEFQYGELNAGNRAHKAIIELSERLKKEAPLKVLTSPLEGRKDKEKDKESVLEREVFDLEEIYNEYPSRPNQGKGDGLKSLSRQIVSRDVFEECKRAAINYRRYCESRKTEPEYIKQFKTWCGSLENQRWREWVNWDPSRYKLASGSPDIVER